LPTTTVRSTRLALRAGIVVPILYFGTQLLAAPFYPGYSFRARDASTLGSPGSTLPVVFNAGAILIGVVLFVGAWGFFQAMRRRTVPVALTWLTSLALVAGGIGSVNAGLHPLPDPRHTDGLIAAIGGGLFLVPLLLLLVAPRMQSGVALNRYLAVNLAVVVCLALIMSGLVQRFSIMAGGEIPGLQEFLNQNQGLLQRIAAVAVFVPIGVCAAAFMPPTGEVAA
jgi:hypothetical protein